MSMDALTPADWLGVLSLGVVCGAVGQVVRALGGLAKLKRENVASPAESRTTIQASVLVGSLIIGGVAGALAALALIDSLKANVDVKSVLGLMMAGYAGADFIEGAWGKIFSGQNTEGTLSLQGVSEERIKELLRSALNEELKIARTPDELFELTRKSNVDSS